HHPGLGAQGGERLRPPGLAARGRQGLSGGRTYPPPGGQGADGGRGCGDPSPIAHHHRRPSGPGPGVAGGRALVRRVTNRPLMLITGASAGLGEEFARLYAAHGWDLVLTARRGDRLESLAAELRARHGARVLTIPLNLAEAGAPDRLMDAVEA